ncbi:MAG: DUF6686 family protein [Bizionia paragorgiae]|uniref:DUF6686 family protein n=1 Tax=Bizionia paragorgiae TaxID=283786 RepID=UPI003C42C1AD
MCHSLKILSKGKSGSLSVCQDCDIYYLEFNNLYFEFNNEQFKQFRCFLLKVDSTYWETKYANADINRKIPIPSEQENLVLMFNRFEIEELKDLILNKKSSRFLTVDDIDYRFFLN